METIVKIFKALSDETRLKILMIISSKVICQRGISNHLQISDSAVSQHKDHTFIDINNMKLNKQCCKASCKGKIRCCKKGEEI